jgi:hypothetical protein
MIAVHIEWVKTGAQPMHWVAEVDLLEKEIQRIHQFLVWWEEWGKVKVNQRGPPEGPQCEGETAYALRQAGIQAVLTKDFAIEWVELVGLISRWQVGKAMDNVAADNNEEGSDESGMGSSGEEDKPIPSLPQRTVKPTYVNEVLVM